MSSIHATHLLVLLARTRQRVGRAGLLGVFMVFVAVMMVGLGWQERKTQLQELTPLARISAHLPLPSTPDTARPQPSIELAPSADVPLLTTQVEHAALANGLTWNAAEFRQIPSSAQGPSSLEILCTLKGPYPKLRRAISQMLATVPGLTLGPLTMSRSGSDAVDVEAKLVLRIFLADDDGPGLVATTTRTPP